MSHCKSREIYLFTNLTLEDADDDCRKVRSVTPMNTYGQIWISVGRQVYNDVDKGYEIRSGDYGFYKACEICFNKYCLFIQCDSKIPVSRMNCGDQDQEITKKPGTTQFTTSTSNITSTTTETGITLSDTSLVTTVTTLISDTKRTTEESSMGDKNATDFNIQEKEAGENNIMVKVFVPIATVVVIGVVLGIFLFKSRQKSLKEMQRLELKPVTLVPDLGNSKSKCTASENAENACNKGMEDVVTEEETMYMYNDQTEGTYDHLRDSDSRRRKATEDVYYHANFTNSFGSSVYDFAGRSNKHELDDVYDHTNVQRGSDYASNVVKGTTVNCDYASIQT